MKESLTTHSAAVQCKSMELKHSESPLLSVTGSADVSRPGYGGRCEIACLPATHAHLHKYSHVSSDII